MYKGDTEEPSHCITTYEAMSVSNCVYYVPHMQLFFFLSISSCLAADRSSASHLWASDEPSSDHIRHGEAISARTFFSHGVLAAMTSPLALCWLGVRLSACLSGGTSPRYTDRERGVEIDRESDTSGSSICNSKQVVYHTSPHTLSACAMLGDTPEDCHIVHKAAQHRGPTDGSF